MQPGNQSTASTTMRSLIPALLLVGAVCGLGWYAYSDWVTGPEKSARPGHIPSNPANPDGSPAIAPTAPGDGVHLDSLLARNEFDAAVAHYEFLQTQASDAAATEARTRILSHASRLIEARRFSQAEQLLQPFLLITFRDVEARTLLAAAFQGQQDLHAAIDQLYEARGKNQ